MEPSGERCPVLRSTCFLVSQSFLFIFGQFLTYIQYCGHIDLHYCLLSPFLFLIPGLPTSSPSDHTMKDDDIPPSALLTVPRETSVHDRTFRVPAVFTVTIAAGSGWLFHGNPSLSFGCSQGCALVWGGSINGQLKASGQQSLLTALWPDMRVCIDVCKKGKKF